MGVKEDSDCQADTGDEGHVHDVVGAVVTVRYLPVARAAARATSAAPQPLDAAEAKRCAGVSTEQHRPSSRLQEGARASAAHRALT
jgi:hypothetical protein